MLHRVRTPFSQCTERFSTREELEDHIPQCFPAFILNPESILRVVTHPVFTAVSTEQLVGGLNPPARRAACALQYAVREGRCDVFEVVIASRPEFPVLMKQSNSILHLFEWEPRTEAMRRVILSWFISDERPVEDSVRVEVQSPQCGP